MPGSTEFACAQQGTQHMNVLIFLIHQFTIRESNKSTRLDLQSIQSGKHLHSILILCLTYPGFISTITSEHPSFQIREVNRMRLAETAQKAHLHKHLMDVQRDIIIQAHMKTGNGTIKMKH